ncbi:MAG: translation initiation factor [Bacteroidales bacterium]|nr:translation initiation factor [Bacteroidales bacterium]
MSKQKRKKDRIDIVYSTNPDFSYSYNQEKEHETLPPTQQKLYISLDRKNRKGKSVTLVSGFVGKEADLKDLGKRLKVLCGSGGAVKDNSILLQGDFREKIIPVLQNEGYQVKRHGG